MARGIFTGILLAAAMYGASFEVASIRPSSGPIPGLHGPGDNIRTTPGSVTMRNISLTGGLAWAYDIQTYQISGPGWMSEERFDIVAKAPAAVNEDQLKQMMQALLAERFQLKFHKDEKVLSGYAIVVGKHGHKLQESPGDGESKMGDNGPNNNRPILYVQHSTIRQFAEIVSRPLRAPVFDKTGLKGKFDFKVDISKYVGKDGPEHEDPISIISAVFQEQLGLKLESSKGPSPILVIDRVEKAPIEN